MAKILSYEGIIPKRIGDYVIYKCRNQLIIRTNSGFTSEAVRHNAKYAKTRNNAKEFGRVSSLCKQIRMALAVMLPKQNNLAVVNSFTKKMREVMTYDLISLYGERNLAEALKNEVGRQLLQGYDFNPDSSLPIDYEFHQNSLVVKTTAIVFPNGSNCLGFRLHTLYFDFTNCEHELQSGDWNFYSKSSLPYP